MSDLAKKMCYNPMQYTQAEYLVYTLTSRCVCVQEACLQEAKSLFVSASPICANSERSISTHRLKDAAPDPEEETTVNYDSRNQRRLHGTWT